MINVNIKFNESNYIATYNEANGYYEIELEAPNIGGVYNAEIDIKDEFDNIKYTEKVQIFAREKIKLNTNKIFMWIFDSKDFSVKDIVELSDYEINIDEETNSNTIIKILKKTTANAKDIIAIKKNNEKIYFGIIENIENENGYSLYQFTIKYITNIFNQNIKLGNENTIKNIGIEDFIADEIKNNFINNSDTFINKKYLEVEVKTHTKLQTSVTNVTNNIYNLHTWMTNCTQNYNITYEFKIVNKKLIITIENKVLKKELVDVKAQPISNYSEVFQTDIVAKVIVLTSTDSYTLYLKNDRSTTEDMNDINRADGRVETVYTENYEDARQKALDTIKQNTYNHNITFNLYDKLMNIGTPVAIKTKESLIFDTYISAIKITQNKFYEYTCGNIRINFIDKLLKERRK